MATVSVEFSVYSDPRYKLLGKLTKTDQFGAIGRASALWMHCIERNTSVLSKEIVDAMANRTGYAQAMIKAELAEPIEGSEGFVRIKGTQGRIEWLSSARERQKKASEAARLKRLEKEQAFEEALLSETDPDSNVSDQHSSSESPTSESDIGAGMDPRLESSSASTSSSASVSTPTSQEEIFAQGSATPDAEAGNSLQGKELQEPLNPDGPSATALTWRSYRDAYQERYGEAPVWNAKTAGQLRSFVGRVPKEEAPLVAAFYLTHKDQFYVKSMHPVGLLLRDAEKLRTEWVTGRQMTGAQAKHSEQRSANVEAMKSYLAKKGMTHG